VFIAVVCLLLPQAVHVSEYLGKHGGFKSQGEGSALNACGFFGAGRYSIRALV
jgi:hypothetical protein